MHGGIQTQQQSAARQAEQSCPRNGIGIAGWVVALASAVVLAVAHRQFRELDFSLFRDRGCVIFDIKGILPKESSDGRL